MAKKKKKVVKRVRKPLAKVVEEVDEERDLEEKIPDIEDFRRNQRSKWWPNN